MIKRRFLLSFGFLLLTTVGLNACNQSGSDSGSNGPGSDTLQIWWSEGYYPEETEAIRQAVAQWEEASGKKAELTFYSEKDLLQQSESAIAAGNPPDILYGYGIDLVLVPQLAWNGKLADVSSVIEPIESTYTDAALQSVLYFNSQNQQRSYYAVPISQQTTHIHYWQDLLVETGTTEIPQEWDSFWQLWDTAQTDLRQKGLSEIYAKGLPVSQAATDTYVIFEQFLEAYDVQLLDANGQLLVNEPTVRSGIVAALTAYTAPYKEGAVPENAIDWGDPDNNVIFLSNLTIMTPNPTLSIPGSQRQDDITYLERMRTVLWPNKPSGQPMRYITSVKQVVVLADSNNVETAKDFLTSFVEKDTLRTFVEGAQGRYFPVMPELAKEDFWTNPDDPHISVAAKQFDSTRPAYSVLNPAYSEVRSQNVWGKAIYSIVVDNVTPEKAADQAIKDINQIFTNWQ